MTRLLAILSLTAIVLLTTGCGELRDVPTGPGGGGPPDPAATFTRVQSEVFTASCTFSGCHDSLGQQAGLNLSAGAAHAQIVNKRSTQVALDRVEPGVPEQSYLLHKVAGGGTIVGDRMPLSLPPLTDAQVTLLRDWIRRGAPND